MRFMLRFIRLGTCILLLSCSAVNAAEQTASAPASSPDTLELRMPFSSDGHARYFIRLLEESLKQIHQPYHLDFVHDVPARRMWHMLSKGDINLFYGMQTREKDSSKQLILVRNGLTNGLIGQRVFLTRRADAEAFAQVQSIADLKRTGMIAGFGAGWRDAKVWKAADLPSYEHAGPWGTIYAMVDAGNRHVDYLPRGVIEVQDEARRHPELVVEQHLLVEYQGDLVFYLAPSAASYRPILERALKEAEASGLKSRLIDEAFGADLKALGLNRRVRLHLQVPE